MKDIIAQFKTEVVFILDRSGSMAGLESDTIGGYNSVLATSRLPGITLVSTVLFDNEVVWVHDRADIREVSPLTSKEYYVRGSTALLDAIGESIHRINAKQKADKWNMPDRTLVVIITDGMENSSRKYSYGKVKKMIEKKQKKGWEFLFLGANMDAIETAGQLGIDEEHAVNHHSDSVGTKVNYKVLACTVANFKAGGCVPKNWKDEIEKDYRKRK